MLLKHQYLKSSNGGHSGVIFLSLKRTFFRLKNDPRDAAPGRLEWLAVNNLVYFRGILVGPMITLRDVSYNARWFWTTIRYGPMTTAYLCWTTGNGF